MGSSGAPLTAAAEESRVSDTHFERGAGSINSPIHPA